MIHSYVEPAYLPVPHTLRPSRCGRRDPSWSAEIMSVTNCQLSPGCVHCSPTVYTMNAIKSVLCPCGAMPAQPFQCVLLSCWCSQKEILGTRAKSVAIEEKKLNLPTKAGQQNEQQPCYSNINVDKPRTLLDPFVSVSAAREKPGEH